MEQSLYSSRNRYFSTILIVLAVLTLSTSCSVKKTLQAYFDFPINKNLNPSKTAFSGGASCKTLDLADLKNSQNKESKTTNYYLPGSYDLPCLLANYVYQAAESYTNTWPHTGKIPLYILYKKMKVRL